MKNINIFTLDDINIRQLTKYRNKCLNDSNNTAQSIILTLTLTDKYLRSYMTYLHTCVHAQSENAQKLNLSLKNSMQHRMVFLQQHGFLVPKSVHSIRKV